MNISTQTATTYTGDRIQGIPVISTLNVNDLEPGQKHRFYFQGVQMGTGQHWYVPVEVAKGDRDGKRILLTSGVHGDELSSVSTMQRIMAELAPTRMAGTAIAAYDLARPAREYSQRFWPTNEKGRSLIDFNRVWPGDEAGNDSPTRHAGLLWNRLFKENVDLSIDFHTAATDGEFAMFIFADLRNPDIQQMAELFPAEQIKNDPGEEGTLELAFIQAGIPSMTVEIGAGRLFDKHKIALAVEGGLNVFRHYRIIDGIITKTSREADTFFGDSFENIRATTGGYLELLVTVRDRVKAGETVALQRNAFGDVVAEYRTNVSGEIATIARDAVCEPGTRIVQILYSSI